MKAKKVCMLFAQLFRTKNPMFIHHNLDKSELIDLLAIHTDRFMQIVSFGEKHAGEYNTCKRTIELIQNEIMSRSTYAINPLIKQETFSARQ